MYLKPCAWYIVCKAVEFAVANYMKEVLGGYILVIDPPPKKKYYVKQVLASYCRNSFVGVRGLFIDFYV